VRTPDYLAFAPLRVRRTPVPSFPTSSRACCWPPSCTPRPRRRPSMRSARGPTESSSAPTARARADRHVVVLTAGISADSGVRTFRDAGGLWEGHRVEDVATPDGWERDPRLVWRFYQERRAQLRSVAAERRARGPRDVRARARGPRHEFTLVTQNVDDLHDRAGSDVLHMHGELQRLRCERCEAGRWRTRCTSIRAASCRAPNARTRGCGRTSSGSARCRSTWPRSNARCARCTHFVAIGTSGQGAGRRRGMLQQARGGGARARGHGRGHLGAVARTRLPAQPRRFVVLAFGTSSARALRRCRRSPTCAELLTPANREVRRRAGKGPHRTTIAEPGPSARTEPRPISVSSPFFRWCRSSWLVTSLPQSPRALLEPLLEPLLDGAIPQSSSKGATDSPIATCCKRGAP
jgi:NAD-dependent deacetylase